MAHCSGVSCEIPYEIFWLRLPVPDGALSIGNMKNQGDLSIADEQATLSIVE